MKRLHALTLSICLFALISLAGCGENQPKPLPPTPATTIISDPVPAYKPVDHKLTDQLPQPVAPPMLCSYGGVPVVCVLDGLLSLETWRGLWQQANLDRATTAKVTAPASASSAPGTP